MQTSRISLSCLNGKRVVILLSQMLLSQGPICTEALKELCSSELLGTAGLGDTIRKLHCSKLAIRQTFMSVQSHRWSAGTV